MISVYKININDISDSDYKNTFSLLKKSEQDRIIAINKDSDKKRSLATKYLLQRALLENFPLNKPMFNRDEKGKPVCDFCFVSLSHSEDMAVCALSSSPVGIDVEKKRNIKRTEKYHFFSSKESAFVNSADGYIASRFLEVFTRKEAYFKCADVSAPKLSSIDVLSDSTDYSFKTEIFNDYIISLCLKK